MLTNTQLGTMQSQLKGSLDQVVDLQGRNEDLVRMLEERTIGIEGVLRGVMQEWGQREVLLEDNERLDEIITKLEKRNRELEGCLNQDMRQQAADYEMRSRRLLDKSELGQMSPPLVSSNQQRAASPKLTIEEVRELEDQRRLK